MFSYSLLTIAYQLQGTPNLEKTLTLPFPDLFTIALEKTPTILVNMAPVVLYGIYSLFPSRKVSTEEVGCVGKVVRRGNG